MSTTQPPVALITGAARRIGADIAKTLHSAGYNLILHCRTSSVEAQILCDRFNQQRENSAVVLQADLLQHDQVTKLAMDACNVWGQVDLLINNASSFYPTPIESANMEQWDDLMGSNLKAPYFLSVALAETLKKQHGAIINVADIHGDQPLANHSIYCMAKAGNRMMTKTLAKELAPNVRVNGIAPGAIMWPEDSAELSEQQKENILTKIPLNRTGSPGDISSAALFLATSGCYMTGQVIAVDGGRSSTV